jgi:hypothetical protein
MEDYLVEKAEASFEAYVQNYMSAATFEDVTAGRVDILGWFNNEGFHTPAVTLSLLGNALLDYFVHDGGKNYDVEVQ